MTHTVYNERASGRDESQFSRHTSIVSQERLSSTQFKVIGSGSLGSLITHALAMMGGEDIEVYDDDVVELHNLSTQLFAANSVRNPPIPKVAALQELVGHCHKVVLKTNQAKFTEDSLATGVIISGVDEMASRKAIWKSIRLNPKVPLYIDTRAAGRVASIFCINPVDLAQIKDYEATWLFDQEQGVQGPCTEKMTTFVAWSVGAYVAALVNAFLNEEPLPYHIDVDMATMSTYTYGVP